MNLPVLRRLSTAVVVSALMVGPQAPLLAQEAPRPSSARLFELFEGMAPSQDVQVVTPQIFIEQGQFSGVDAEVVEIETQGSTIPVSLADIRAVSVRSEHGLQGALWGVGVGLVVGAVAGLMVESFHCDTELSCSNAEKRGAVRWGVSTGLIGGLVGYLLGRRDQYWRPVFP